MRALPCSVALVLTLAACSGKSTPDGQVIASVDGEEITRAELNAALSGINVPPNADKTVIQNNVLDQLVTQKLAVEAAKQQKIDKSQEYLLASRRANEQILVSLYGRRIVQALRTPYAQDADRFIAANPTRFGQRTVILVDQVRVPDGAVDDAALKGVHTLDGVIAKLNESKIEFQRGRATVDSATLEPAGLRQLMGLPPGEPFVVHESGMTIISSIVGTQPAPLEGDEAKKVALQVIQQDAQRTALTKQLDTLRQRAKITYQAGFAAPKRAPTAATGAPAAPPPAPAP